MAGARSPVHARAVGSHGHTFNVPAALVKASHEGQVFDLNRMSFFVSRETIVPRLPPGMALWREIFFKLMLRNAASATEFFQIPAERVVELGTQIEI